MHNHPILQKRVFATAQAIRKLHQKIILFNYWGNRGRLVGFLCNPYSFSRCGGYAEWFNGLGLLL